MPVKMIRHELPPANATRLLVDGFQFDVAVTMGVGDATGVVDRTITGHDDGSTTTTWSVRVDGIRGEGVGMADVQTDSVQALRDLSLLASALADELATYQNGSAPPD